MKKDSTFIKCLSVIILMVLTTITIIAINENEKKLESEKVYESIEKLASSTSGTATATNILNGKVAIVNDVELTGTMANKSGTTTTASTITESGTNALITIPASGYYDTTSKISVPISTIKTEIGSGLTFKTTNISNVASNIGSTSAFYYGADTDALFLGVNTWTTTGTGHFVNLSTLTSTTTYDMFYQASWGSEYSFTMTVNPSTRRVTLTNTDGNVVGKVTEIIIN